eukprot:CAMPEP_0119468072 /NCGR_PEP_ID=MMETSP1344-20130328/1987_1 /TAXON_ID=236787 /ORGANISM="Florenciella parvula, Strain CCMP2471" /LENGTH=45 /DNA_ID= /DNA_START= /DNA_END= /DNA_ORIENTATION=
MCQIACASQSPSTKAVTSTVAAGLYARADVHGATALTRRFALEDL